jgi:hypothetical protein
VSGNWHAETTSSVGPTSFDLDFFIAQNGASLASSTVFFTGTPCANDGTLTGTVDRQAVDLTILESGGPEKITINASTDGVTMTGTYTTRAAVMVVTMGISQPLLFPMWRVRNGKAVHRRAMGPRRSRRT